MARWWFLVAFVFWLCSIYTAAVSIMVYDTFIANVVNLARFVSLTFWFKTLFKFFRVFYLSIYYICTWIIVMRPPISMNMQPRSQGSLLPALRGTRLNKHVVLPQKIVILHLYLPITATSPQRPLSSPPEVVVVERFDCSIKLPHFSMFQQQVVVNWNGHTPYLLAAWVDQRQRGTSSYRPLGFHLSF